MSSINHRAGRPQKNTVEQRRNDLLFAALDLFVEHGYAAVSMAMVARVARVAIRTIHVKFGDKNALLKALIEADADAHREQLKKLQLEGLSFAARLEKLGLHLWQRSNDRRQRKLRAIVFAHPDHTFTESWRQGNPGQLAKMMEKEWAAAPIRFIDDMTPTMLWEHFLACVTGAAMILGSASKASPQEQVQRRVALFIRAVSV